MNQLRFPMLAKDQTITHIMHAMAPSHLLISLLDSKQFLLLKSRGTWSLLTAHPFHSVSGQQTQQQFVKKTTIQTTQPTIQPHR